MASNSNAVLLGPYSKKQKLYLETEDGVAMEGEFVKFNASKTSVLLHQVELVPSDGRTFEQYCAVLSELVCLRPLENSKAISSPAKYDEAEKPQINTENYNDLVLPEIDNSEEARQERAKKFEARKSDVIQRLMAIGLVKEKPSKEETKKSSPAQAVEASSPTSQEIKAEKTKTSVNRKTEADMLEDCKSTGKTNKIPEVNDKEETVSSGIYEALKSKAKGYIIIDKPGAVLQSAMQDIAKRSVIGLGGHGAERGRLDRLSILSVVTESAVYLLDVHSLGKQVLTPALARVLESKTVEKVTYDCMYLTDCLYYSHQIRLQNVYDIQAADCVMYRCRKGTFPNRGRGLPEIVSQYLDLPAALLADKTNITNYKVWFQRPLQEDCYGFAAWQVVFLPELRTALDKAFQNLMQNSMDVYLNHIRKMKRGEMVESLASRRQIPVEFLNAPFIRDT